MSLTYHDEDGLLHQERIEQPATHSVSSIQSSSKAPVKGHCKNVGLSGRLMKGAGTHLESWLQELSFELSNVSQEEVYEWLLSEPDPKTETVLQNVIKHVGTKRLGHNNPILSVAYSGELFLQRMKNQCGCGVLKMALFCV